MSGGAAGRDLRGDDRDEFEDLLDTMREYFESKYFEHNQRMPATTKADRHALLTVVYDEAAGRIDIARACIDEMFSPGLGRGASFFQCALEREEWKEQGRPQQLGTVPRKVRTMLATNFLIVSAVVQRLQDQRRARAWRKLA